MLASLTRVFRKSRWSRLELAASAANSMSLTAQSANSSLRGFKFISPSIKSPEKDGAAGPKLIVWTFPLLANLTSAPNARQRSTKAVWWELSGDTWVTGNGG